MVQPKSVSKIVIRRLPPDMTEGELLDILSPLPPHDYFKFHPADTSLIPYHTTRAYINFPNFEDILNFRDKFDAQIFEDKKGHEYPAYVEVSTFQLIPKDNNRDDKHNDTIADDEEFQKFKELYEDIENVEVAQINVEEYLKEAAAKDEARKQTQSTPLIDFIRSKRETKKKQRDDRRRDERKKRRDDDRKAKRKMDHKERSERKKDLIDAKNKDYKSRDYEGENGTKSTTPEANLTEQKPDHKKGGRFAAREKRKKEFEERRKLKQASDRAAKKSEVQNRPETAPNPESGPKPEIGAPKGNKRYSRRKDPSRPENS